MGLREQVQLFSFAHPTTNIAYTKAASNHTFQNVTIIFLQLPCIVLQLGR